MRPAARQFYEQGLNMPVISSTTIATPQVYSCATPEVDRGLEHVTRLHRREPL